MKDNATTHQRRFEDLLTPQQGALETPREIDVRSLRLRMHLTQDAFAGCFGFPVATLRHWERGNRRPTGSALVLLHVIRDNPRAVLQAVRKARIAWPDLLPGAKPPRSSRAPPGMAVPL